MTDDDSANTARGAFWFFLTLLLAVMAMTVAVHAPSPMPRRVLSRYGTTFNAVWPQHWSFFADTPDQQVVRVYRWSAGTQTTQLISQRHLSDASRWGLGREALGQIVDIFSLVGQAPAGSWRQCTIAEASCVAAAPTVALTDRFPESTLCGSVVVAYTSPWRSTSTPPAEIVKLAVTCQP